MEKNINIIKENEVLSVLPIGILFNSLYLIKALTLIRIRLYFQFTLPLLI